MYEINPGILEKDWSEIERKINLVKPFVKTIHIDVIDGKFAPNTTFLDPTPFTKYSNPSTGSGLFFEAHLMVEEPTRYLKPFAAAGFKRFLGHIEKMSDQAEFVAQGQLLGEVGVAIDAPTTIDEIKVRLEDLDTILIMTVKAGEAGQVFVPECLRKVETLKQAQHDIQIEVDGGINDKTIVQARNVGATRFVVNSFIFNSKDPQIQYQLLERQLR